LPSAVRWLRRRLLPVRMSLMALVTMMPDDSGSIRWRPPSRRTGC
jgi:hypothetical protein